MKENRYAPFLKWYPYLARSSPRWNTLSLAEKGFFHELYDLAAISEPRGTLLMNGVALDSALLANLFREPEDRIGAMLARFCGLGLLSKNLVNAFYFPDWNTHQRNGPLRRRASGTDLAQNGHKLGAPDVDVDVEVDVEVELEVEKDCRNRQGKELVILYGEKVKQPSTDTSIPQARKNAAKLLKTVSFEDLTQAVLNYAESCEALDKENDFRKNAGNFFGRESVYENFLPSVYQKPQAAPSASAKRKAKLAQWAGKGEKA